MQLLVIDLQQCETVGGGAMGGFLVSRCIDEVVEIILSEASLGCPTKVPMNADRQTRERRPLPSQLSRNQFRLDQQATGSTSET